MMAMAALTIAMCVLCLVIGAVAGIAGALFMLALWFLGQMG